MPQATSPKCVCHSPLHIHMPLCKLNVSLNTQHIYTYVPHPRTLAINFNPSCANKIGNNITITIEQYHYNGGIDYSIKHTLI